MIGWPGFESSAVYFWQQTTERLSYKRCWLPIIHLSNLRVGTKSFECSWWIATTQYLVSVIFSSTSHEDIKGSAGMDSSVVECRNCDRNVSGSSPGRNSVRIFLSRVSFRPCWLLFRYMFHARITAVARKISRSFCQNDRLHLNTHAPCVWGVE